MAEYITHSREETVALGRKLAAVLPDGALIAFTGGLGAHYGAERVGASVIPVSGGNTTRQLLLLKDLGSTCLCFRNTSRGKTP